MKAVDGGGGGRGAGVGGSALASAVRRRHCSYD